MFTACQSLSLIDGDGSPPHMNVMPLWDRYQRCLRVQEPEALLALVLAFASPEVTNQAPPAWMKAWSRHVAVQPLRVSVDPMALRAECLLRTAAMLAARERWEEARRLYRQVLLPPTVREGDFYAERAKSALALLPPSEPSVIALRSIVTGSRPQ
jgi:hypothetical protein